MDHEIKYMARALQLASSGLGSVAPNPMVGAVIVYKGKIIGEGFHQYYGGHHAEVNAVKSVQDKSKLKDSTLYVNLEPCNHTGLTPPCTNLILENKIPRVVIGQPDPHSLVGGRGIERLKANGVDTITGVLEKESRELNRRFNTFHENSRPYIILKWAMTADGFVDIIRKSSDPIGPNWITDEYCRRIVHKWRSEESAILAGTLTALKDNPKLNVRSWTGNNPLRIVLDRRLILPEYLHLMDGSIPTIVYSSAEKEGRENLDYVKMEFDDNILESILADLHKRNIQSVIIEGGPKLLTSFIEKGLWDEARVFTGPMKFGNGVKAPRFDFIPLEKLKTGNSQLEVFRKNYEL